MWLQKPHNTITPDLWNVPMLMCQKLCCKGLAKLALTVSKDTSRGWLQLPPERMRNPVAEEVETEEKERSRP